MCVCLDVCVYVYVYTYVCIRVCLHRCVYTCVYIYVCVSGCVWKCVCVCMSRAVRNGVGGGGDRPSMSLSFISLKFELGLRGGEVGEGGEGWQE